MKKKQYIIGKGYPMYGEAVDYYGNRQTSHGLGSIKLYSTHKSDSPNEIVMLSPKGTHNGKKYKLILEEI